MSFEHRDARAHALGVTARLQLHAADAALNAAQASPRSARLERAHRAVRALQGVPARMRRKAEASHARILRGVR